MFETACPIPAAQYLRMSAEHQQYSIENQIVAIQRYATVHGFFIVQSYTDAGKSGLVLNQREGLRNFWRMFSVGCGVQGHSRFRRKPMGTVSGCR
jgi:DNA invertase Pin-like site-specific DNA recombinase